MAIKKYALIIICSLALVSCAAQKRPEAESIASFWHWFKAHEQPLSQMRGPDDPGLFQISDKIHDINPDLAVEIAPGQDEKQLAISAQLNPNLFPLVEKVVKAAPPLKQWKVVAFRQRSSPELVDKLSISARPLDGKNKPSGELPPTLRANEIKFTLTKVGDHGDLVLYLKDYKGKEFERNMASLLLQQATGEYDLVMKIGDISFKPLSQAGKDAKPLMALGPTLDTMIPSPAQIQ